LVEVWKKKKGKEEKRAAKIDKGLGSVDKGEGEREDEGREVSSISKLKEWPNETTQGIQNISLKMIHHANTH
jgi:hypothetical protein